jgi:hypothetical protein
VLGPGPAGRIVFPSSDFQSIAVGSDGLLDAFGIVFEFCETDQVICFICLDGSLTFWIVLSASDLAGVCPRVQSFQIGFRSVRDCTNASICKRHLNLRQGPSFSIVFTCIDFLFISECLDRLLQSIDVIC